MRKSCVQPVEMPRLNRGNEHILYTKARPSNSTIRVQPAISAQFFHSQAPNFPQAKDQPVRLLLNNFSPLSTRPITTITIYITN